MTNLLNKYLEYQINFEKKYGKQTLVLMQVGSFLKFMVLIMKKKKLVIYKNNRNFEYYINKA